MTNAGTETSDCSRFIALIIQSVTSFTVRILTRDGNLELKNNSDINSNRKLLL